MTFPTTSGNGKRLCSRWMSCFHARFYGCGNNVCCGRDHLERSKWDIVSRHLHMPFTGSAGTVKRVPFCGVYVYSRIFVNVLECGGGLSVSILEYSRTVCGTTDFIMAKTLRTQGLLAWCGIKNNSPTSTRRKSISSMWCLFPRRQPWNLDGNLDKNSKKK